MEFYLYFLLFISIKFKDERFTQETTKERKMFEQEIKNYFHDLIEEVSFQEFEGNETLRKLIHEEINESSDGDL